MDFIFITSIYDDGNNDAFAKYLAPSIKNLQIKCVHITDKKENNDIKQISSKYNVGIDVVKKNNLINNNTCIIFSKSDTHIIDNLILDKLELAFTHNPNIAVIGVAGSKVLNEDESLYSPDNKPVNGIIVNSNGEGNHIQYTKNGFFNNIVAVDDSLFAVSGAFLNDSDFHFLPDFNSGFGIDVSIVATKLGYDVICADILVSTYGSHSISFKDIKQHTSLLSVDKYPIMSNNIIKNTNSVVEIEL